MTEKESTILRVREFTRFYMSSLSLFGNNYLNSDYSAAEARVLFELYEHNGCNAAFISRKMNIDKSYLSRILKKHEKSGLIERAASESDLRTYHLMLTEHGTEITRQLISKSNAQIEKQLNSLSREDCRKLTQAIDTITTMLSSIERME